MKRVVWVKNLPIGGNNKITIQSMTNTPTADFTRTCEQIKRLIAAGCDIIRLAVCSDKDIEACKKYISMFDVPLVADIQFDYHLAVKCSDIGFGKVRINPGNIGSEKGVSELIAACKTNGTPIRIGVNGGSLEKNVNMGKAEALAESALKNVALLEKHGFNDIVISVKSSDVRTMIEANRIVSSKCGYPLHIGVTESGDVSAGTLKSAIGIGALLVDGIGDTVRVSLTGDPVNEVKAARDILRASGVDKNYCEIISCPTCSRCSYDLAKVVSEIREFTKDVSEPLKIAIMGCVVNGPGEAKDADCGVAGGADKAVLFKNGEIIKTIDSTQITSELKDLISNIRSKA